METRNLSLTEIDPKGILKDIFRQYIQEVGDKVLSPKALLALRQKFGLSTLQFKILEDDYLEEQRLKRERERERRYGTKKGHGEELGLGITNGREYQGRQHKVDHPRDRGDYL